MKNIYKVKGNIFITSDEDIKDCYVLTDLDKIIKVDESNEEQWHEFNCEKIILATDEQLISDGVQSIDKPFLIWLINNPNCDEVQVYYDLIEFEKDSKRKKYITIIPKEEPKQGINIQEFEKKANEIIANVGKKETIEQAAKEYEAKTNYSKYVMFDAFIAGAKSDAAKDYWFNQFKNKIK